MNLGEGLKKFLHFGKEIIEAAEPFMDLFVGMNLLSHSQRTGKHSVSEKLAPKFAKSKWHESRNALLLDELDPSDRVILAVWMNGIEEPQQHHWIVSIANMSWGENPAQETANTAKAVKLYEYMATLPDDDSRTAYADSIDFIRDPVDEYWIVKVENFAGRSFDKLEDLADYLKTQGPAVKAKLKDLAKTAGDKRTEVNAWLEGPAKVKTEGWLASAKKWRDKA